MTAIGYCTVWLPVLHANGGRDGASSLIDRTEAIATLAPLDPPMAGRQFGRLH